MIGLLDAALVMLVFDASPDAVHLRRRTDLRDEHSRDLGHELMTLVVRRMHVHAQYVSARTRMEPTERATRIEVVTAPVALPPWSGSGLPAFVIRELRRYLLLAAP